MEEYLGYYLTDEELKETCGYNRRAMLEYILKKGKKQFSEDEKKKLELKKGEYFKEHLKTSC